MATPHHIPAIPTAAPIKVGLAASALVRGEADLELLDNLQRYIARDESTLSLAVPPRGGRARLALAAALAVGGHVLVLTKSSARRKKWRRSFRKLCEIAPGAAMQAASGRGEASLTCITAGQLAGLLAAGDESPALAEPPLSALDVLIVDAPDLERHERAAIDGLLSRVGGSQRLVIWLTASGYAAAAAPKLALHLDPALVAAGGKLRPYQCLYQVVACDSPFMDERREAALEIIRDIARETGPVDFAAFVAASLPRPHGSARSAYLHALSETPSFTMAVLRVHLFLGGELRSSVRQLLDPLLGGSSATPTCAEWTTVLEAYLSTLKTFESLGHGPNAGRQIREALRLLAPAAEQGRLGRERARARCRGAAAVARDEDGVAIVVLPDGRAHEVGEVAERLAAEGVEAIALRHGAEIEVGGIDSPLSQAAREAGLEEISPGRFRCQSGDEAWVVVATWMQEGRCVPVLPSAFAADERLPAADSYIYLGCEEGAPPLQLELFEALSRVSSGVANLWRILVVDPSGYGERELAVAAEADESSATVSATGDLLCGAVALTPLLARNRRGQGQLAATRAFNLEQRAKGRLRRLAAEGWSKAVPGTTRQPAVIVQPAAAQPPVLTLSQPADGRARMSERRARMRLNRYTSLRRQSLTQAVIPVVLASLMLPTLAGPILGSLVGLGCVASILLRSRTRLRSARLATLHRPIALRSTVRDVACVVLRTLRSCEGIRQASLPTTLVKTKQSEGGSVLVWLDVTDRRLARLFTVALEDALSPVSDHRYIVGRPEMSVPSSASDSPPLQVASYHPVPRLFGARRECAELYAGHWCQIFGAAKLRYTASGKGRLLRFAHFERNHLGVAARLTYRI